MANYSLLTTHHSLPSQTYPRAQNPAHTPLTPPAEGEARRTLRVGWPGDRGVGPDQAESVSEWAGSPVKPLSRGGRTQRAPPEGRRPPPLRRPEKGGMRGRKVRHSGPLHRPRDAAGDAPRSAGHRPKTPVVPARRAPCHYPLRTTARGQVLAGTAPLPLTRRPHGRPAESHVLKAAAPPCAAPRPRLN
jgi:hypothetical protein